MKRVILHIGAVKTATTSLRSHLLGNIKTQSSGRRELFSEQFEIDDRIVQAHEARDIIGDFGDVNFFSLDIVHRSGFNQSNKFRIVLGARYHNMYADDFNTGELTYVYT